LVRPPRFHREKTERRLEIAWGWLRQNRLIVTEDEVRSSPGERRLDVDNLLGLRVEQVSTTEYALVADLRKGGPQVLLRLESRRLVEEIADEASEILRLTQPRREAPSRNA